METIRFEGRGGNTEKEGENKRRNCEIVDLLKTNKISHLEQNFQGECYQNCDLLYELEFIS